MACPSPRASWRSPLLVLLLAVGCHKSGGSGADAGATPEVSAPAVPAPEAGPEARAPACSADGWCETMRVKKGSLFGLWGVSAHDLYALWGGLLVHETDLEWRAVPIPAQGLLAITGTGAQDVWVVGENGIIWHATSRWGPVTSGTKKDLRGAFARAKDDVWIVGAGGTLLHYGGTEVKSVFSGATSDLLAAWADESGEAWAVGDSGTALHWLKGAWTPVPTPTKQPLGAVWGSGPSDVWAVGGLGTILHWNGNQWAATAPPTSQSLYSVRGISARNAWAVGAGGTIVHWDGSRWSLSPSNSDYDLHAVWPADDNDVWTVGFSTASGETGTLRRHR